METILVLAVIVPILCLMLFPLAQKNQEDVEIACLKEDFINEMKFHNVVFL